MAEELRKTGIPMLGDIAWGAHFCLFYETKEDLLDLLIPYFKAGLENREFCLCVASEPVIAEDAERELRAAVPDFDRYLAEGQIEIVSHLQWYLTDGHFDPLRVRQGWIAKLEQGLARGYTGMRFAANTFWLEKQDWDTFADYEGKLDKVFGKLRIMAVCAYSLVHCSAGDMLDVVRHHQFSLARRHGAWERLEGPELQRAHAEIRELNAELERRVAERTAQLATANEQLSEGIAERTRAEEAIRRHAARMEVLATISQAFAQAGLDYEGVLGTVAQRTAELIGDSCVITLFSDDRQRSFPVAFHHPDPKALALMQDALLHIWQGGTDTQRFGALLSGEAIYIPVVIPEEYRAATEPEFWPYLDTIGISSVLIVPLRVQNHVIGTLGITRDRPGSPYTRYDQALLHDLADRAALTIQTAQLFEQVQRAHQRLQTLSRQLLQAQEVERRSIARELHDEIGQQLTGLGLLLGSSTPSPHQLADAQALVFDLIARLRNLSLDLRPTILDDLGLLPALVWLFERYTTQTNVSVRFEHGLHEEQRFGPDVETTAYRIIQEALTNVARHAGVSEVTVRLWIDANRLWMVIADQGRGFDPQAIDTRASTGLAGIQERAALLGGSLTIEARSGDGTQLTAILPIHSGEAHEQERIL
jgi:signal transduction histidine kinase